MKTEFKQGAILILLLWIVLPACSDKYLKYSRSYKFQSQNGIPDYSNLYYWAAHPLKKDPSDSIPAPLVYPQRDTLVDVFFIHPTTYTNEKPGQPDNASIEDSYINAKTDYSTILYQASVFNGSCRVFAPRYRQAHLSMFIEADTARSNAAFELAYLDIRNAFLYYLDHFNNHRPFIIAAHSQGTLHAKRLIKEFIENNSLRNRMVCAYLLGLPIASDYFRQIKPCKDSLQTGCFVTWRTFRKNYEGNIYVREENYPVIVTNPLSWTTDSLPASKSLNKGAVLYKFNSIYPHTNDAQVHGHVLWISRPRFPWGFLYFSKNYHPGDINLFYMNIREDISRRIGLFWKN